MKNKIINYSIYVLKVVRNTQRNKVSIVISIKSFMFILNCFNIKNNNFIESQSIINCFLFIKQQ